MSRLWVLLIVLFCACSNGRYEPPHAYKYNYKIVVGFDTETPTEIWVYRYRQIGKSEWEYLETKDSGSWSTINVSNKNVMIVSAPKD